MSESRKVYLVQAVLWAYNDAGYDPESNTSPPLLAFARRSDAEAHCQKLEAEVAAGTRPSALWFDAQMRQRARDRGEPYYEFEVVEADWE